MLKKQKSQIGLGSQNEKIQSLISEKKELQKFFNENPCLCFPSKSLVRYIPKKRTPDMYEPSDEDENSLNDNCPCCGYEYDEIDYEYQICHRCKFTSNLTGVKTSFLKPGKYMAM